MKEDINGKAYHNIASKAQFLPFVCAYLNCDGGNIVIGTDVDVAKLLESITPHAPVFFRKGNGEFFLVDVPPGNDKPYSCDGRFYVMRGDNAVPASAEEIKDMLLAAQVSPLRWERWFSDGIGVANFDGDELQRLFADEDRHSTNEVLERLERMGLSRQGRFTNATDVLLCKDVAARHPQIRARAIACMDKTDDVYQGHATFEGPLLKVFNGLNHFVMEYTRLGERFSDENPAREAIYQYPLKAVREGLINALVHRDYESYEGTVNVEIHKDHLVISNTGGLYGGMTIERLKAGHLSAFRNPDMANYLNVRGFMEMTGRGSVLIQESCRANGLPEPQWTADENSVTLTFTAKSGMSRQVAQDGGVEKGKEKGREKSKEKSKEKILALLSVNPHATTADLIAETGLSVSGVEKNIRELKAAGRLMRVGPDKGGHWEVVEP